jgi:hypothetical protein
MVRVLRDTRPTAAELQSWPVIVDVVTAGACFGLGRDASYAAARAGDLPGVVRIGRKYAVVTAALRQALGVPNRRPAVDCGEIAGDAA